MGVPDWRKFLNKVLRKLSDEHKAGTGQFELYSGTLATALLHVLTEKQTLSAILVDLNSVYYHLLPRCAREWEGRRQTLAKQSKRDPNVLADLQTHEANKQEIIHARWRELVRARLVDIHEVIALAWPDVALVPVIDHPTRRPTAKLQNLLKREAKKNSGKGQRAVMSGVDSPSWPEDATDVFDDDGRRIATVRIAQDEGDLAILQIVHRLGGPVDSYAVLTGDTDLESSIGGYGCVIRYDKSLLHAYNPWALYRKGAFQSSPHFPFPPEGQVSAQVRLQRATALSGNDYTGNGLYGFGLSRLSEPKYAFLTTTAPSQLWQKLRDMQSGPEALWEKAEHWDKVKALLEPSRDDGMSVYERAMRCYDPSGDYPTCDKPTREQALHEYNPNAPNLDLPRRPAQPKDRIKVDRADHGVEILETGKVPALHASAGPTREVLGKHLHASEAERKDALDTATRLRLSRQLIRVVEPRIEFEKGAVTPFQGDIKDIKSHQPPNKTEKRLREFVASDNPTEEERIHAQQCLDSYEQQKKTADADQAIKASSRAEERKLAKQAAQTVEEKGDDSLPGPETAPLQDEPESTVEGGEGDGDDSDVDEQAASTSARGKRKKKQKQSAKPKKSKVEARKLNIRDIYPTSTMKLPGRRVFRRHNGPDDESPPAMQSYFDMIADVLKCGVLASISEAFIQFCGSLKAEDPEWKQLKDSRTVKTILRKIAQSLERNAQPDDSKESKAARAVRDNGGRSVPIFSDRQILDPMLSEMATSISTTRKMTIDATISAYINKLIVNKRFSLSLAGHLLILKKEDKSRVERYTKNALRRALLDAPPPVNGRQNFDALYGIMNDLGAALEKNVMGWMPHHRQNWVRAAYREAQELINCANELVMSDARDDKTLRDMVKASHIGLTCLQHFMKVRLYSMDLGKQPGTGVVYAPQFISFSGTSTWWFLANCNRVLNELKEWRQAEDCSVPLPELIDEGRQQKLQEEVAKLRTAINIPTMSGSDAIKGKVLLLMQWLLNPSILPPDRIPTGFWATDGCAVHVGTLHIVTLISSAQKHFPLQEPSDTEPLPHAFFRPVDESHSPMDVGDSNSTPEVQPQPETGEPTSSSYQGTPADQPEPESGPDPVPVIALNNPRDFFGRVVEELDGVLLDKKGVMDVRDRNESKADDVSGAGLWQEVCDKLNKLATRPIKLKDWYDTLDHTREGLPSWFGSPATLATRGKIINLLESPVDVASQIKSGAIRKKMLDPDELKRIASMELSAIQTMLDDCIIINIDAGYTFALALEILAFNVNDVRVARHVLVKSSVLQSITNHTNHLGSKPAANRSKLKWYASQLQDSARARIVDQICEVAGLTAFDMPCKKANGERIQVRQEDLQYRHLSSTKRRHVILNVGADSSHPGKKRGVHSAAFGGPLVRALTDRLRSMGLSFWGNRIDEFRTSKSCPFPDCTKDELRSSVLEAPFLDKPWKCHRVVECEGCGQRMNRDIVGASNIGQVASFQLASKGLHPFRPELPKRQLMDQVRVKLNALLIVGDDTDAQ